VSSCKPKTFIDISSDFERGSSEFFDTVANCVILEGALVAPHS